MKSMVLPLLIVLIAIGGDVVDGCCGVQCADPCTLPPCNTKCTYEEITGFGSCVGSVCLVGLGGETECSILLGCDDNTDCSDDFFGTPIASGECMEVINSLPTEDPVRFCRNAKCPDLTTTQPTYPPNSKGVNCQVIVPCWNFLAACELLIKPGTWDASKGRCIQCGIGALDIFEIEICGDSGGTYVTDDGACPNTKCGVGTEGHTSCMDIPDTCEVSCPGTVDTACDEKVSGEQCVIGATCESTGAVCTAGIQCKDDCQCGIPTCTYQLCEGENGPATGTPLPCTCGSETADTGTEWCCATVDVYGDQATCTNECVPPCTYFDCKGANDGSTALIPKPCMCDSTLIDATDVNEYCCGLDGSKHLTIGGEAACRAASACKGACPSDQDACESAIGADCTCNSATATPGEWCCATAAPYIFANKAACNAACIPPTPPGCTTMGCDDEQFITGQTHVLSHGTVRLLDVDCGGSKAAQVGVTLPWGGTDDTIIDNGNSETYLNGAEQYVVRVNWIMCGAGGTTVEIESCCLSVGTTTTTLPVLTCPDGIITGTEDCDPDYNLGAGPGGIWKNAATFASCVSGICDLTCHCLTCGDGVKLLTEECDPATYIGTPQTAACITPFCNTDCTCPVCGNGATEAGEECEPPGAGPSLACEDGCDADCHCITTTTLPSDTAKIMQRSEDIGCWILVILQMIAASVAAFLIVVSGITLTSAEDDPARVNESKDRIRNIVIGLIIVITALQLVNGIFGAELGTIRC